MILHGDKARPAILFLKLQRLGELRGVHRRRADVAGLTGLYHVIQCFQRLFDRGVIVPAVDLQQVNILHAESAQAVINRAQDLRAREPFRQIAYLMVDLGGDHHLFAVGEIFQRPANDLFAAAVRVAVRGIEKVDAALKGVLDDESAALFWQGPGVIAPVRFAKGHTAQTKTGNLKICFS